MTYWHTFPNFFPRTSFTFLPLLQQAQKRSHYCSHNFKCNGFVVFFVYCFNFSWIWKAFGKEKIN
jgi:hypothetical protein